jgi:hypothetical protein
LVIATNDPPNCHDLDLGGLSFVFFLLASLIIVYDPLGHGPHVDHHFPSVPSWLQLLVTFLVVMIVILVV